MVLVQASKLPLPSSPSLTTSILFDPFSLSLALMHSDSSISLYPSISPTPSSLPSKPQTLIPPPSSSSSFLLLRDNHSSEPTVLFVVAAPYMGGAKILLKLYVLNKKKNVFTKAQASCSQKGIGFDPKLGVLLDVDHGVSIKIVGSVNFFSLYSVSSRKVWVFAVKLIGEDGGSDGDAVKVKLMRCAVIECRVPVFSISVSFGFLILGEDGGVRVLNLKQLVKGKVNKARSSSSDGMTDLNGKLPNGVIGGLKLGGLNYGVASNGILNEKMEKQNVSAKQRSVRRGKDSGEAGSCFVPFKGEDVVGLGSSTGKAVSIQALSPKKFMILNSTGDLHILSLSIPGGGWNIVPDIRKMPYSMKVQKLAILPDISSRAQTVWVSDGLHSVHMMSVSDLDDAANKVGGDANPEMSVHFSVLQVIFAAEKIQDLKPSAANGVMILGHAGNAYTYATP
ncbi:unnamed protein product [Linum tenue]|uniref:Uncharacterized protein n=1 Tax=Linum tenue TaxID=586396 RepID=A0AAV0MXU0_9ROSI|nr:unnamed protein product [Linum tenue]